MGYGSNINVEVKACLNDCNGIGAEWVNAILAEVPMANEALVHLNTLHSENEQQYVNWGIVREIEENELGYYIDCGEPPLTIKLWWGEAREGIHVENKFCALTTIAEISRKYPNTIFNVNDEGVYSGNCSHQELVIFKGEVVARVADLHF